MRRITTRSIPVILALLVAAVLLPVTVNAACGSVAGSGAASASGDVLSTLDSVASSDEEAGSSGAPTTAGGTAAITVSVETMGSGKDKVTYYVADVRLAQGTDLLSAFAGETCGAGTADTSTLAEANNAVLAINGDYCGARDDGIVIRNGVIYRDVPARQGLAVYEDGTMEVYDETATSASELLRSKVWITCSFGPGLLVDGEIPDCVDTYEAEADPRHPIQGTNPRTGIGLIAPNHFLFVVVDGRSPGYSRGVTVREFAELFRQLGCTTAYNLDGGGSSTLYYLGKVVNTPCSKKGERAVSDILFVK